ncbi:MAG: SPOR domain-containing protein [Gemmatimonadaceae bacterium]|nr:SPOR domain-containing protein [Gemmatimonadaceae bacterium]
MRTPLLALLLALAACSGADDRGATSATAASPGPDAIILRVPAAGGAARAYLYPRLDSVIWRTRAALPAHIQPLAFNIDAGTLALADSAGVAWRLTLGSGQLERAFPRPLGELASLDGTGIFGTHEDSVYRLTASDATPWQVRSDAMPSQLQPLRDGGVLIVAQRIGETRLSRYRPPAAAAVDTAVFTGTERLISAAGGDRYYLSDGPDRLRSVRARDLEPLGTIAIGDSIVATASSPSGDRVYVLGLDDDEARVQVINKYTDEVIAKIEVPANASALRMDPLGRYLLVRHGPSADSVLVVGIATDEILGRFASPWRGDLPMVFPDGRLATLRGNDVVVLSAGEFRPQDVIAGGAADIWTAVQWNGFRRRAGDPPPRATAALADTTRSARPADSLARAARVSAESASRRGDTLTSRRDTATRRVSRADSVRRAALAARADSQGKGSRPAPEPATAVPAPAAAPQTPGERGGYLVQFAALKAEQPARQLANAIRANGERARVVATSTNGIPLYRVILGPFRSRADAERAGQAAGRDYWVFEGGTN